MMILNSEKESTTLNDWIKYNGEKIKLHESNRNEPQVSKPETVILNKIMVKCG